MQSAAHLPTNYGRGRRRRSPAAPALLAALLLTAITAAAQSGFHPRQEPAAAPVEPAPAAPAAEAPAAPASAPREGAAATGDDKVECAWQCLRWSKRCNVDPRGVYRCDRMCDRFEEVCE
ncbi:MAG: hypothetical protein IT495_04010 [Gammaproteobacteria bacterium]|nr:hypothetical protein [Gammaproteobacteria bacterium]